MTRTSTDAALGARGGLAGLLERRRYLADLALVLVTIIWGSTFVFVKDALTGFSPFAFIAGRFALGGLILLALFGWRLRRVTRAPIGAGTVIGLFLFAGYASQTVGLQYTSAAKAGFITGLSLVLVPLAAWVWLRQVPIRPALIGVGIALVGLALISFPEDLSVNLGDLLVLGCAVAFALHIVSISRYAPRHDALTLAIVQVLVTALLGAVGMLLFEGIPRALPPQTLFGILFTGVLATALVLAVQTTVQGFTSPTHAALIFTLEPVVAAVAAFLVAGEVLTVRALIGGALIVVAMLVAELWRPAPSRPQMQPTPTGRPSPSAGRGAGGEGSP